MMEMAISGPVIQSITTAMSSNKIERKTDARRGSFVRGETNDETNGTADILF